MEKEEKGVRGASWIFGVLTQKNKEQNGKDGSEKGGIEWVRRGGTCAPKWGEPKGTITGTFWVPWATLHIGHEGADAHTCRHTQSMHTPWLNSLSHLFVV